VEEGMYCKNVFNCKQNNNFNSVRFN
jgi:hypothetical protein